MSCALSLFEQLEELQIKTCTKISDEIRDLFININVLVNEYLKEKKDSCDSNRSKIEERVCNEEVCEMTGIDIASTLNPQEKNKPELRESQIEGFPYLTPIFPGIYDEKSYQSDASFSDEESNVSCNDGVQNDEDNTVSNEEQVNSFVECLTSTNQNINVNPIISFESASTNEDRIVTAKSSSFVESCNTASDMNSKSNLNHTRKKEKRISRIYDSKYQCIKCYYGTNSGSKYVRHYKKHIDGLNNAISIFECHVCKTSFGHKGNWKRHMSSKSHRKAMKLRLKGRKDLEVSVCQPLLSDIIQNFQ